MTIFVKSIRRMHKIEKQEQPLKTFNYGKLLRKNYDRSQTVLCF